MKLISVLHLFTVLALLLGTSTANATHMVGGEINYRCLGNDQYEIMVTVFRDCDTGVPWFDNPASVGVFDVNDSLIYDLRLSLRNNDTLDLNLSDPCLVAPPNVCIHTTTYLDTVTLAFIAGGYQVVYQRCCRNQDIVNIVAPTSTGATYTSFISEEALLGCNSSAIFNEWPPVYICAGVPIVYDHSALDSDGDSIVYELCTPYTGATPSQSMPQPPINPPYNPVTWLPPYGVDNMLGGPDSLIIDAQTGLLTGTPDIIGVFVVGVCAKEYRNGQLISTTRRDFQYVVGQCGRISSSSFFAPDVQCDNSLIVNFQNNSSSIGSGFLWSFGDSSNLINSTVANPTYIYPDTGLYNITLIVDPGTLCADTSSQQVYLQYESIQTNFDVSTVNCTDSFYLDVTDLTIDTISNIIQWNWDFGNGQSDTIPYPTTVYSNSGSYIIQLDVLAANGCTARYTDTFNLDLPRIFSADTVAICPGDSGVVLNPGGNPNHLYQWSPNINLSSDTVASPVAFPTATTNYNVTVVVPNGIDTCLLERSITVLQSPPITLTVSEDTFSCIDSVMLYAQSNTILVEWSTTSDFSTIIATGDSLKVPVVAAVRYYVRATNPFNCYLVDSIDVVQRTTAIVALADYQLIRCDTTLEIQFNDLTTDSSAGPIVSWEWQFGDGAISMLQHPIHQYSQSGTYLVVLTVTTSEGCFGIYQWPLSIQLPLVNSLDTVGICPGFTAVQLNQGANPALNYQWSPATGLNSVSVASPIANPSIPTTYTVTVTAVNGLDTCANVQQIHVNFPPPFSVSVPSLSIYCGTTVDIQATATVTACTFEWSGDPSFNAILGTGNPYTATPFTFPFAAYYVRATDPYGCTATDLALVQQNPVPLPVAFSYTSLGCSDTIAIQFTDLTSSSPSSPLVQWLWTTSDGQSSTLQNPIFVFTQSQPTDITLQVINSDGCIGQLTQSLQLNIARINNDSSLVLCGGDSTVQLNQGGNPNLNYSWSPAAYVSNVNAVSPVVNPPQTPFTYTVTVTGVSSVDSCFAVHDITLTQAPPITIEVPKDTVVCSPLFNIQASVMNAQQIDWSFSPTFSPVAISNVTNFYLGLPAAPYDLQLYIRATDTYGCIAEDTARVLRRDIDLPVQFVSLPSSCDDTLDLTLLNTTSLPTGVTASSWTWTLADGTTANTYNASAQITNNDTSIIRLNLVAENGCTGSYEDTLVYYIPALNGPDSIGLCAFDSIQLNPNGSDALIYTWSPAAGLSSTTASSPMAQADSTTLYTVTVTAINGLDSCTEVHQVLLSADTFQFEVMPDTVLCVNQIMLSVVAPTASFIEWAIDRDFNFVIGQSSQIQTSINDSRWFYVRGNSLYGCTASDSVFVQYRGNNIPVDFEMDLVSCQDSVLIQFYETSGDSTILSWNWDFGNGQTAFVQNPLVGFLVDSTYLVHLTITVKGNCNGVQEKPLQIQIPRSSLHVQDSIICRGDSIVLSVATDSSLNVLWYPNQSISDPFSLNPIFYPDSNQSYVVRIYAFNSLGASVDTCWLEDSIQINVKNPPIIALYYDSLSCDTIADLLVSSSDDVQFIWSDNPSFSPVLNSDSTWTVLQNTTAKTYYIEATDTAGCSVNDSITVISRQLSINLPERQVFCDSQAISLSLTNLSQIDSLTYTWSPSSIVQSGQGSDSVQLLAYNGFVQVIVQNQYGCMDSAATALAVANPFNLVLNADSILCDPLTSLWAYSTALSIQFDWYSQPNLSNLIGQGGQIPIMVSDSLQSYYVQASDSLGCSKVDSVQFQFKPVSIFVDSAIILCKGDTAILTAYNLLSDDSLSYNWSPELDILSGQGSQQVQVAPLSTSYYTLTAQNQLGCIATQTAYVAISTGPVNVDITADKDSFYVGDIIQLNTNFQADYSYLWQEDSTLNNLTIFNPLASPVSNTSYFLTVVDSNGCISKDSISLILLESICQEPNIFIANAFSPDKDGYNDKIFIQGTGITELYFVIYNRWGEQVFETRSLQHGWDGSYKGKACSPDVYGYYVQCRCLDGRTYFKKGNITLLK